MKSILFNTEMVKAILDGRKTQTRRVFSKTQLKYFDYAQKLGEMSSLDNLHENDFAYILQFSQYKVGDILWARETWCYGSVVGEDDEYGNSESWLEQLQSDIDNEKVFYKADMEDAEKEGISFDEVAWKPSIHMPKKYARIFLKVTKVKVERLQDASDGDIEKEGIVREFWLETWCIKQQKKWIELWNSTAKDGYKREDNPYVFVYEFERVNKLNISNFN